MIAMTNLDVAQRRLQQWGEFALQRSIPDLGEMIGSLNIQVPQESAW